MCKISGPIVDRDGVSTRQIILTNTIEVVHAKPIVNKDYVTTELIIDSTYVLYSKVSRYTRSASRSEAEASIVYQEVIG